MPLSRLIGLYETKQTEPALCCDCISFLFFTTCFIHALHATQLFVLRYVFIGVIHENAVERKISSFSLAGSKGEARHFLYLLSKKEFILFLIIVISSKKNIWYELKKHLVRIKKNIWYELKKHLVRILENACLDYVLLNR